MAPVGKKGGFKMVVSDGEQGDPEPVQLVQEGSVQETKTGDLILDEGDFKMVVSDGEVLSSDVRMCLEILSIILDLCPLSCKTSQHIYSGRKSWGKIHCCRGGDGWGRGGDRRSRDGGRRPGHQCRSRLLSDGSPRSVFALVPVSR